LWPEDDKNALHTIESATIGRCDAQLVSTGTVRGDPGPARRFWGPARPARRSLGLIKGRLWLFKIDWQRSALDRRAAADRSARC